MQNLETVLSTPPRLKPSAHRLFRVAALSLAFLSLAGLEGRGQEGVAPAETQEEAIEASADIVGEGSGRPAGRFDAVIILGQSNAVGYGDLSDPEPSDPSVWLLGNDYQYRMASEPIDDSVGQVDAVSGDYGVYPAATLGHSWILRAAKGITQHRGNRVLLIPCQRAGTWMYHWTPGTNRFDRSTLFGSANYRRRLAAPDGLKAIWYYGHESNSEERFNDAYTADWTALVKEFRSDYGEVPIVYAQLASIMESEGGQPGDAERFLRVAEQQRQLENLSRRRGPLRQHAMVVTFDLPLADYIHLNRVAVNTLADRFALATREHIYRERVNGTGPRLAEVRHMRKDRSKVVVVFDRGVNVAFNDYDRQFRVYDNGVEVPVQRAERYRESRAVLLTLQIPAQGSVTVSYGGRPLTRPGIGWPNVVKDWDGLPAPQFRLQPAR